MRASHLSGWTGEPDPYVKFRLYDPTTGKHIEQMSGVVYNEASPRWNEKFDFIMVPAGSQLLATIYDKTTVYEKVVTLKIKVGCALVASTGVASYSWLCTQLLLFATLTDCVAQMLLSTAMLSCSWLYDLANPKSRLRHIRLVFVTEQGAQSTAEGMR